MIEKAALQIINGEEIIESKLLGINEEVEEFIRRHVMKSLNSMSTYKAVLLKESSLRAYMSRLVDDKESFLEVVTDISKLYEKVSKGLEDPYCDLLFAQYIADEQRCYAMLRLDFKKSYNHFCTGDEYGLHEASILPGTNTTLTKCLFFSKGPELEVLVIDKKEKVEDNDYFVNDFMEGLVIRDDVSMTRRIKSVIESWINRNLMDQIEAASSLRSHLHDYLQNEDKFVVEELADFFEHPTLYESLNEHLKESGIKGEFQLDKTYIEKNLQSRSFKTDSGFSISGGCDGFKDVSKFSVKENGDGTMDYIIKNVRNITEK